MWKDACDLAVLVAGEDGMERFRACSELEDPRRGNAQCHELLEILQIALLATLCGAEGCVDPRVRPGRPEDRYGRRPQCKAFWRRHGHGWSAAVMSPASGAAAWPRALVGQARIGAPIRLTSSNGALPSAGLAAPGPTGGATTTWS
jgi:hypothetical protein